MPKKYRIRLTREERESLEGIVRRGKVAALKQRHARILLLADENAQQGGASDEAIAAAVAVAVRSVERVRQSFVEEGLEAAMQRKAADRIYPRRLDGVGEARLIAIACGPAPEGRARWSLRLLADKLVELEVVDSISRESVRRTLKKTRSSPG
jgi:hypothetical protein